MSLMTRTFQQWSKRGYKIKKGSKAIWVDNIPMFSKDQVEINHKSSYHPGGSQSEEYYREMDEFYGTDYFH